MMHNRAVYTMKAQIAFTVFIVVGALFCRHKVHIYVVIIILSISPKWVTRIVYNGSRCVLVGGWAGWGV
jgi:hypothetical protein